ncbi:hypothetical protein [Streptomyces sp. AK02-01A]|uniref:hypothetical protein n=1 Tax=Streptomyces sp. AK02-01A TaxID=3028648 RepID=UPI0029A4B4DF|nr:hypothetical protein [Streptomyces sp. AK02-01A]MDX3851710.1 hypothetical protein [Streptomyces sp. AK02-01A]
MLAVGGCSPLAQNAAVAVRKPAAGTTFDKNDPGTWVLPIQAYLPTDSELKQISGARKTLVQECMKSLGFSWNPVPDLPQIGPKTLTDWRYGIHDLPLAEKRGYKPDAGEQAAYDAAAERGAADEAALTEAETSALNGGGTPSGGKKPPSGGCVEQANRKLSLSATDAVSARKINADEFNRAKLEPEVVRAFAAWSACLKEGGYSYKEPLDASDDERFASAEVTPLERATATADIRCRRRTQVAKIWFDAEVRLQKAAIEDQAEALEQERRRLDAAVKKAAEAVAQGSPQ